jgi:hypothetical protein
MDSQQARRCLSPDERGDPAGLESQRSRVQGKYLNIRWIVTSQRAIVKAFY